MANRVLIGKHASLPMGLYVSKPGQNAQTATGDNLIFNSNTQYGGAQIHQVSIITIPSGGTGTASITGLGYIPFIHVCEFDGSTTKSIPAYWNRVTGSSGCVMAGTMIKTPKGDLPVEELKIGDTVIGYDIHKKELVETYIMQQSVHETQWYYKINDLKITAGHPIWTERGWSAISTEEYYRECKIYGNEIPPVEIRTLEIGDKMFNSSVEKIERVSCHAPCFNIEVNNTHNYIADNILVHNGGGQTGGGGGKGGGGGGRAQIRWAGFRVRVTSSQVTIFPTGDTSASSGDSFYFDSSHHGNFSLDYPPASIVGNTYKVIVYRIETTQ